eukprot:COSAG02_NODE_1309_length_13330_cov_61.652483_2_plen_92_part_00
MQEPPSLIHIHALTIDTGAAGGAGSRANAFRRTARYAYVKRVADDERTAMLNGGKIAVGSSRRLRHILSCTCAAGPVASSDTAVQDDAELP